MQEKNVSENCITALENELIIAIQAVRHVRRCYERPPSSTQISKGILFCLQKILLLFRMPYIITRRLKNAVASRSIIGNTLKLFEINWLNK
jgi:hypothetical protein